MMMYLYIGACYNLQYLDKTLGKLSLKHDGAPPGNRPPTDNILG